MENFLPPSRRPGKDPPLQFSLSQAAALCGVPVHRLSEWADCGYVRVAGQGDGRRFDRYALRQILLIRNATRSNAAQTRHVTSLAARVSTRAGLPHIPPHRAAEFSAPGFPLSDTRLTLQIEIFFALNPNAPRTVAGLAAALHADPRQTRRLLDSMVGAGVVRALKDGEIVYGTGRARLRGPNIREQRIRATRRPRLPATGH